MTYYLIGKGGTTPSNPETTFKNEEETKTNSDTISGLNEDFKIDVETNANSFDNPVHNNTTERILTEHIPEETLDPAEDFEVQNPEHDLDLPVDHKYHLSEDTSPLISSSTAVISGSSETHLLQKSDADG
jgi:hypothetical protein